MYTHLRQRDQRKRGRRKREREKEKDHEEEQLFIETSYLNFSNSSPQLRRSPTHGRETSTFPYQLERLPAAAAAARRSYM